MSVVLGSAVRPSSDAFAANEAGSVSTSSVAVTTPGPAPVSTPQPVEGKTVVHCHGCFDIVHPGHIQHLQFAKSLGDILVVTVSADLQVNKGINRPLIPDDLRAGSLAALECVNHVYVNADPTAVEILQQLKPDI